VPIMLEIEHYPLEYLISYGRTMQQIVDRQERETPRRGHSGYAPAPQGSFLSRWKSRLGSFVTNADKPSGIIRHHDKPVMLPSSYASGYYESPLSGHLLPGSGPRMEEGVGRLSPGIAYRGWNFQTEQRYRQLLPLPLSTRFPLYRCRECGHVLVSPEGNRYACLCSLSPADRSVFEHVYIPPTPMAHYSSSVITSSSSSAPPPRRSVAVVRAAPVPTPAPRGTVTLYTPSTGSRASVPNPSQQQRFLNRVMAVEKGYGNGGADKK